MTDEIDLSDYAEHLTDKQLGALVRMVFDHFKDRGIKVHVGECGIDPRRFGLSDEFNIRLYATVIIGRVLKYALEGVSEAKPQNN